MTDTSSSRQCQPIITMLDHWFREIFFVSILYSIRNIVIENGNKKKYTSDVKWLQKKYWARWEWLGTRQSSLRGRNSGTMNISLIIFIITFSLIFSTDELSSDHRLRGPGNMKGMMDSCDQNNGTSPGFCGCVSQCSREDSGLHLSLKMHVIPSLKDCL